MNWIEGLYDIKGKDLYSQNGEGLHLEYIFHSLSKSVSIDKSYIDIGAGDGFILSNTRHLRNMGWTGMCLDKTTGQKVDISNIQQWLDPCLYAPDLVSIDIDGNDFWVLDKLLSTFTSNNGPLVIIAEFNAAYAYDDSKTIEYDKDFEWQGDDYFGFSFKAGEKLAEKHGYKVVFQNNDMNTYLVRSDLVNCTIPPITYNKSYFFKKSERKDWIYI